MSQSNSKSWLPINDDSPFSLANIPFGIITSSEQGVKTPAVIVGEHVLVLKVLADGGAFSELRESQKFIDTFSQQTLNAFAALGREAHRAFRSHIQELLKEDTPYSKQLRDNNDLKSKAIFRSSDVVNHLPLSIGDYTDFYAGQNHAFNVGVLFRGAANALQPNYKHLPVGYHGRASSIQVSGTPVRRPNGQILPSPTSKEPIFSPCKKLDMEVELAAFVCKPNEQGSPVSIDDSEDHIFGYVLMNDWSARDIQAWEYVPLGPFNSKNFATTISPWVVLTDALEPFRAPTLEPSTRESLLPYLRQTKSEGGYDITIKTELAIGGKTYSVSQTNASNLLFSFGQMLTHHTVGGCPMNVGDLLGSGTISGLDDGSLGSFLEMTKNGKAPLELAEGVSRTFLEDDDDLIMTGAAGKVGGYVGFGECRGKILPARSM